MSMERGKANDKIPSLVHFAGIVMAAGVAGPDSLSHCLAYPASLENSRRGRGGTPGITTGDLLLAGKDSSGSIMAARETTDRRILLN
jgi:hypothetical protein